MHINEGYHCPDCADKADQINDENKIKEAISGNCYHCKKYTHLEKCGVCKRWFCEDCFWSHIKECEKDV